MEFVILKLFEKRTEEELAHLFIMSPFEYLEAPNRGEETFGVFAVFFKAF
jgi:hypothetical protein